MTSAPVANSAIPGSWVTVTFDLGAGYLLQSGTQYAIQINSDTAGLYASLDTAGGYTRGIFYNASDDQSYWNDHGNVWDIWFEEWGTT